MDKIYGRWRVKMRGWWWWWFYNVKVIWPNSDGTVQGHNILWGIFVWGRFDVRSGSRPRCGILTLNYRFFRDWVYEDGDEYRGELFIHGIKRRMASFQMIPILKKKKATDAVAN